MMIKKVFSLSILLVTYNHQKHIRQAMNALFAQKIHGPIQLVVADDMSSDDTLSIVKEFEGVDDRFVFKYLDNGVNLGITKNYRRGFAACSGEYVAVLEGDDYWVSPFKLKRQSDFLTEHWESDLCSVNYFVYEEDRAHLSPRTTIGNGHRFLSARDLIADNLVGNFSTCMYRRSALLKLPPELYDIKSYDWITNICIARDSLIGFLEEPMSVYRLHSAGVWTQTPYIDKLKIQLEVIPGYDALTDHLFHEDFERLAAHLRHVITASQIGNVAETVSQPVLRVIPSVLNYLPPILIVCIRAIMPVALKNFLVRIIRRSRP